MSTATIQDSAVEVLPAVEVPPAVQVRLATGHQLDSALREAVAELDEPVRGIVSYHFGWTAPDGVPSGGGTGKMLRSTLVFAAAHAVAGSPDPGLPGAVAVELVHNSSLLQDDVMDGDRLRRHRPAAWTIFGASQALLAGDALIVLALSVMLRDGGPRAARAAQLLARTYQSLVVGQAMDLGLESRPAATVGEYLRMAEGKTASLLACATELGALLGGARAPVRAALRAFGWHLGLAFQIVDDILGIWGDQRDTGKPVGADIRTRKKSFPVAYALSLPEAAELRAFYRRTDPPTPADVDWVTAALQALGARTRAESSAHEYCQAALDDLDRARLKVELRGPLLDIPTTVDAVVTDPRRDPDSRPCTARLPRGTSCPHSLHPSPAGAAGAGPAGAQRACWAFSSRYC